MTERYFSNTAESLKEVNKYFDVFPTRHYLDKQLNKYVGLTNDNFERLVEIESSTLDAFGEKIIRECIEIYNSK